MAQMANSTKILSGVITMPYSSTASIDFGKTINKYMIYVEATDDSKTSIVNANYNGLRTFGFIGTFPKPSFNGAEVSYVGTYFTYNARSGATGSSSASSSNAALSQTDVVFTLKTIQSTSGGGTALYQGLSYNWYIFPID